MARQTPGTPEAAGSSTTTMTVNNVVTLADRRVTPPPRAATTAVLAHAPRVVSIIDAQKPLSLRDAIQAQKIQAETKKAIDHVYLHAVKLNIYLGLEDICFRSPFGNTEDQILQASYELEDRDRKYDTDLIGDGIASFRPVEAMSDGEIKDKETRYMSRLITGRTRAVGPNEHAILKEYPEVMKVCPEMSKNEGLLERAVHVYGRMINESGEKIEKVNFMIRATDPDAYLEEIWNFFRLLDVRKETSVAPRIQVVRGEESIHKVEVRDEKGKAIATNRELTDIERAGILNRVDYTKLIRGIENESEGAVPRPAIMAIRGTDYIRPIDRSMVSEASQGQSPTLVRPLPVAEYIAIRHKMRVRIGTSGFVATPRKK